MSFVAHGLSSFAAYLRLPMELEYPVRIISDVHLNHPASVANRAEELAPLFRDVRTVIFNGDTVELRFASIRAEGQRVFEELKQVCADVKVRAIFVNGNHDPFLAEHNHLDLEDGAILVTHGDIIFYNIAPWSPEATILEKAHDEALDELGEDAFTDFERRLHANKKASLAFELHEPKIPRGPTAMLRTYMREAWPPWRPLRIFKAWWETPARAVALARVFRPQARFVIIGHTHRAGCWRVGPRVVINTGGFLRAGGLMLVDLVEGSLTARKIVPSRHGFLPGKQVDQFPVTKLELREGF